MTMKNMDRLKLSVSYYTTLNNLFLVSSVSLVLSLKCSSQEGIISN